MESINVGGPYFEDLEVGQVYDDAPAVTVTAGHAALYQALFGDRLRLAVDHNLAQVVTLRQSPLAHPNLVTNFAIAQSTGPSQRVRGNLFYRGLTLLRPVFVGDTLMTKTTIVALKQNRLRPGKPATGLALLRVTCSNDSGQHVLDFWRCPMIPLRDQKRETGYSDKLDVIPDDVDVGAVLAAAPEWWDLAAFRARVPGAHFADIQEGATYSIESRDTITGAPEFARLTLNLAQTHLDAGASPYGRRLVYGGHTIAMVGAQVIRALSNIVTFLAWRSCDHAAPVFEEDIIRSEVKVTAKHPLRGGGGVIELNALAYSTSAAGGSNAEETLVLDWKFFVLMA